MAVKVADRFPTVQAWWAALQPHLAGLQVPPAPAAPGLEPAVAVAAAAALGAGIAVAAPAMSSEPPSPVPAPLASAVSAPPPAVPAAKSAFSRFALKGWMIAVAAVVVALAGSGYLGWRLMAAHPAVYYAQRTAVVRAEPDPLAQEITRQPRGSRFTGLLKPTPSGTPWLMVDAGSGRKGYVSTKSLGLKPPPVLDESVQGARRLARDAAAHQAPDAGSPIADALDRGAAVKVVGRTPEGWYEVLRSAGGVEYLSGDAVTPPPDAVAPPAPVSALPTPTREPVGPQAPPPRSVATVAPTESTASVASTAASPTRATSTRVAPKPPPRPVRQASVAPAVPDSEAANTARTPPPPPEIRSVAIVRKPTVAEIMRAYPSGARRREISGSALIDCVVGPDGGMRDCRTVGANPSGQGFEEAAQELGGRYVVRSVDQDGQATAGRRITFEIKFESPRS
jgi:outer membrane biosynthesis protein TonB